MRHLLIAGVNKAGTTSLHNHLCSSAHFVQGPRKELGFFLPVRYDDEELVAPISQYLANFRSMPSTSYAVDSTPGYFYGGQNLCRVISSSLADVKVIICLREPYDRLRSFYEFHKSRNNISQDFSPEQYVALCAGLSRGDLRKRRNNAFFGVEGGFYSEYLGHWLEEFAGRICLVDFDELVSEPLAAISKICRFTNVDIGSFSSTEFKKANKTRAYKSQNLHGIVTNINERYGHLISQWALLKNQARHIYSIINEQQSNQKLSSTHESFRELSIYDGEAGKLKKLLASTEFSETLSWLR